MSMVMILIPLSMVLVGVAVWGFVWAVDSGQFDDLESPGWEILIDDEVRNSAASDATNSTINNTAQQQ